eukprot:403347993
MQNLLPREEILEQVNAQFLKNEGILLVTNVRLLWKRVGETLFEVNENRLHVKRVQKAKDPNTANRYVIRVEIEGKKPHKFSFIGLEAGVISDKVEELLNTKMDIETLKQNSLGNETIYKITELMGNQHLRDIFDELVDGNKNIINETEFWEATKYDANQNGSGQDIVMKDVSAENVVLAGISNKPFLLMPRMNMVTQKTEFRLEESDCKRLLKEFPDLALSYEARVPLRCSESEFWDEFLKKNFQYKTEIFGGNNPIFIPFQTDTKNYEDLYIHNPKLLLQRQVKQEDVKQKAQIDVNFIQNIENLQNSKQGYGTFQNQQELDNLNQIMETINSDMNMQKQKNLESEIQAKKIINKYNQNSSRIIQSNHVKRNIDVKEDEQMAAEKQHQFLKDQQDFTKLEQQNLNNRNVQRQEVYTVQEYSSILDTFQAQLSQIQAKNNTMHVKIERPSSEDFRKNHDKILAIVNESIKLLNLQNDIETVKRKLSPNVFEKLIYYYKKFKVLMRHYYAQYEKAQTSPETFDRLKELMQVITDEAIKLDSYTHTEQVKRYSKLYQQLKKMYNKLNQSYSALIRSQQAKRQQEAMHIQQLHSGANQHRQLGQHPPQYQHHHNHQTQQ